MSEIEKYNETMFEEIKHIDENGNEYWEARELQIILGYKEWRYFSGVMEKAQISCSQSNNSINSNFGVNTKIVKTGVSSKAIIDYKLSRYACYLIVQNANPKHKAVALAQTYFAIQTRKMELTEEQLSEIEKNLSIIFSNISNIEQIINNLKKNIIEDNPNIERLTNNYRDISLHYIQIQNKFVSKKLDLSK